MARRHLYLYIPDFAFDWRARGGESPVAGRDAAAVLSRNAGSGEVVVAVNQAASLQGIFVGGALADARTMVPELTVLPADPAADRYRLEKLADWCRRYTPMVAVDAAAAPFAGEGGSAGLYLDITGCAHLFRRDGAEDHATEEQALARDCLAGLEGLGFAARLAVADAPDAARAVARFSAPMLTLVPEGRTRMALEPLPVAALGLAPADVEALDRVGLRRVAQLVDKPRAPLASRFGLGLVEALDRALGLRPPALKLHRPAPVFRERIAFAEPISLREDLAGAARQALRGLCRRLERRQAGLRRARLHFFRVDGEVLRITVGTSRLGRDLDVLFRLFVQHLDKLDPGFGIETVIAEALESEASAGAQGALGSTALQDRDAVSDLGDRLANRLGADAVHRLRPEESHLPERAERRAAGRPARSGRKELTWTNVRPPAGERFRPVRLMKRAEPVEATALLPDHPPARFRWRGADYKVAHAAGPERLAPEWWRAERSGPDAATRDYFRLEDGEGRRFWLYREGLAERGEAPKWFLHGLFS